MNPHPSWSSSAEVSPEKASGRSRDELAEIRELLLGPEKQALEHLRERLEDPAQRAREVSGVLPQAVALACRRDQQLASALVPAVESALGVSVRRDPSPVVNAVFPIIGPAIRRAIAEAFSQLVQSLNEALDSSFSLRGLRWRFEAARTGKSFGEVVLLHTLVYRVEQLFLIHRASGLVLAHVQAPGIQAMAPDAVSGMLTAIQDFARDSFHAGQSEFLHNLQIGELAVWIESSPLASLAAVIRGQAPPEFRAVLQEALERVHREHSGDLEAFRGDAAPFEVCRAELEACLRQKLLERRRSPFKAVALVVLVVAAAAVWAGVKIRDQRRWASYVQRLRAEPGIVVTATGSRGGRHYVAGLRDPIAAVPADLRAALGVDPARVEEDWQPFQALTPSLVLRRARSALQPPPGVQLRLEGDVLFVEGLAPADWIRTAAARVQRLTGVRDVDLSRLADAEAATLVLRQQDIEGQQLRFDDATRLASGQEPILTALAEDILALHQAALVRGKPLTISVVGHTDQTGTDEQNLRISLQRAEWVTQNLVARGVPLHILQPVGMGAQQPLRSDLPPEQWLLNRRVTFRVHGPASDSPPP
ncbi:MAG: OmpA family protein [Verrucomicrobia bacterium]|nr:OmpA family protein [Verrucomicrobiota bacterium]